MARGSNGRGRTALRGLLGAAAGAAATWTMSRVTTALYGRERPAARDREEHARGGITAYERAAERAAGLFGRSLDDDRRRALGSAVHWATGIGTGALYGVLRDRLDGRRGWLRGPVWGTAVWLVVDELMNPLLGLTPGPRAFPWQAHARGLAGHLAYGVVSDAVVEVGERATGRLAALRA